MANFGKSKFWSWISRTENMWYLINVYRKSTSLSSQETFPIHIYIEAHQTGSLIFQEVHFFISIWVHRFPGLQVTQFRRHDLTIRLANVWSGVHSCICKIEHRAQKRKILVNSSEFTVFGNETCNNSTLDTLSFNIWRNVKIISSM